MNLKLIIFLTITLIYINYSNGIKSHYNKVSIFKCKSAPDLRIQYNESSCKLYTIAESVNNNQDNIYIISSDEYKKNVNNKYKRNLYLRSKEKYTFGDTK
jgi:hypothetical protein